MLNTFRKLCLALTCALLIFPLGAARAEVGVTDDKIVLGTFQDLSGPAAYIGKFVTGIIKVWTHMVNEEMGGIHGRKVEVVIEDNKYDPVLTKTVYNKLVNQDKVFALIATYGSSPLTAIKGELEKDKVPIISTAASTQSMFDPPNRYLFWYTSSAQDEGILATDFIMNTLKPEKLKLGILYQDDEWGKDGRKGIELAAKKYNLKPVYSPFKRGTKNLSAQVLKLKAKRVTHLYISSYATTYASFLKEANKIGYEPVIIGGYVTVDPRSFIAGELADGHYHIFNHAVRNEGVPGWKELEKRFTAVGAEALLNSPLLPMLWTPLAHFTQVLQNVGPDLTREKVIDAMEALQDFDTGGTGPIRYGENMRKGTHYYRIFKADAANQQFIPITDWHEPSLVWGKR